MRRPLLVALALAASLATVPSTTASATATASAVTAADDGGPNTYWSAPPEDVLGRSATPEPRTQRPKPPKTKGTVTGQVVGPGGKAIKGALVSAIRFSDLGLAPDQSVEKPLVTRTGKSGAFKLKQLKEPYLVRVCSPVKGGDECDQESSKRFIPTYVGPDGNLNSWMRHTRMFDPQRPGRRVGRIVVQPSAVVSGTWKKGGANRRVYLTRIDGSIASTTTADGKGRFRFEVAPGPYRLEVDHDEGLRTDATVPGYRSKRFIARVGRTYRDDFTSKHAGIIRGLVSAGGTPIAGQFLAVLDADGQFAAGVTTNEIGRYVISSLQPGSYTVATSYSSSSYLPASQGVTVTKKDVATADLALDAGRSVSFQPTDGTFPGANGSVDAELRNAQGLVVKTFQGPVGTLVSFTGLPAGPYTLYVRRSATAAGQVDFPWTSVPVDLNNAVAVNALAELNRPTVNLTGTLPVGAQVKLTAAPADAWQAEAYTDGDQATPMAVSWTVGEVAGQYVVRGIVPGTYLASVTGGSWATTHSTVIVPDAATAPVLPFTAPAGATVRAKVRYASNGRPVIAPFGLRVNDSGDQSWVYPTVSGPQRYGKAVVVERLHAGQAGARLFDLEALYGDHPGTLIPATLVSSARDEPGTPYFFSGGKNGLTLTEGAVTNAGVIKLKLSGVLKGKRR